MLIFSLNAYSQYGATFKSADGYTVDVEISLSTVEINSRY